MHLDWISVLFFGAISWKWKLKNLLNKAIPIHIEQMFKSQKEFYWEMLSNNIAHMEKCASIAVVWPIWLV